MPAQEYLCTVLSNKMITPTVFEITFEADRPILFKAGQFLSVIIPGAGPKGRDLRRAYSIASPPESQTLSLCIKTVEKGPGTTFLFKLKTKDKFSIFAPYGDFVYHPKPDTHVFFVATSTGISPFRSIILGKEFQENAPPSATCLLGVRDESELLYHDELRQNKAIHCVAALSRPKLNTWSGFQGRVTDYLRTLGSAFPWKKCEFFLCGNGAMIEDVKSYLQEQGVAKTSIHQEVYFKPSDSNDKE